MEGGFVVVVEVVLKGVEGESGSGVEGMKVLMEGGVSNGVLVVVEVEMGVEGVMDGKVGESESGRDMSVLVVLSLEMF